MHEERRESTWPRIRRVLDGALELSPELRRDHVEQACDDEEIQRQVLSMLAVYDDETEPFGLPAFQFADFSALGNSGSTQGPGLEIGPYRLIESLGEGGMGAVFLAQRSDDAFSKQVAIKLIRRGLATEDDVRRFRRERQILADLVHPSIAQLLDGGNTAEGRPYLVMEYVDGQPIDVFCRDKGLSLVDRLKLFLKVCDAVQFAHQNLIVHRDLKPNNILVKSSISGAQQDVETRDVVGDVKLLDFGIAKILEPDRFAEPVLATRTGVAPMTPAYASPEQVSGQAITTASDVYSLGVLLFQLVTGEMPYRFDGRDLPAVVEAIVHREVSAPSTRLRRPSRPDAESAAAPPVAPEWPATWWQALRGDLDAIVLKALAKDPQRRYATAEQLADDLRRFFAHEPVRARHDTMVYRAERFLYRHRLAFLAVAAIFATLLTSVLVLLDKQRQLVDKQEQLVVQRDQAETVSGWFMELFTLPDPGRSLGQQVTARELLDKGAASIDEKLADQPEVKADLLGVLGRTYANLGLLPEARELTGEAVELLREQGSRGDLRDSEMVVQLIHLSNVLGRQGRYSEALRAINEALSLARSSAPEWISRALAQKAHIDSALGRFSAARGEFAEAVALARNYGDADELAFALENYAELLVEQGDVQSARTLYREALELVRRERGSDVHPDVTRIRSTLSAHDNRDAEGVDVVDALQTEVEKQRQLYKGAHPMLARTLNNLALVRMERQSFVEAQELFEQALTMKQQLYGESHPDIATTLTNLGLLKLEIFDLDAAETLLGQAIAMFRREVGSEHPDTAMALGHLGRVQMERQQYDLARESLERALDVTESTLGLDHDRSLGILNNLGELARRRGDLEAARVHFSLAAERGLASTDPRPNLVTVLSNWAVLEETMGEIETALDLYEKLLERDDPERSIVALYALTRMAGLLVRTEQWREGTEAAEQAISAWRDRGGGGLWELAAVRTLAIAMKGIGDIPAARRLFKERLARLNAMEGDVSGLVATAEEDLETLPHSRATQSVAELADSDMLDP